MEIIRKIKKLKIKNCHNKMSKVIFIICFIFAVFFLTINFNSCTLLKKDLLNDQQSITSISNNSISTDSNNESITLLDSQSTKSRANVLVWAMLEPKEQIELASSIELFNENNPNISVSFKSFRNNEELLDQFIAASLAGEGADIVIAEIETARTLAQTGVIKPISDELLLNYEFLNGLLEIAQYENKVFAVPFRSFDYLMLFYNKDLIEKPPVEFQDIISISKEINQPNNNKWGILLNWKEPDWIIPFSGGYQDWIYDYQTNSIFLNARGMIQTLEFLYYLYNKEKLMPHNIDYEQMNTYFKNGNVGMIINGDWAIKEYENEGLNFGVSKIPVVIGGFKNPTPMINGIGFMFNTNSYGQRLQAATSFVEFLLSEEMQISWTKKTDSIPVLKTLLENQELSLDPVLSNQMKQALICRGKLPENVLSVIRDSIRSNIESVIYGSLKPEDAAQKMQDDAIKLISGSIEEVQTYNQLQSDTDATQK